MDTLVANQSASVDEGLRAKLTHVWFLISVDALVTLSASLEEEDFPAESARKLCGLCSLSSNNRPYTMVLAFVVYQPRLVG